MTTARADLIDFFTPGARLALELECLLMDTRNDAAQSRWWASAHEALEQWRQAVRAMEASIDAVQPEASTTLEQAASHAHICSKLAEQYKSDALLFAALTDAAAIIQDLLRDLLDASAARKRAGTSWNRGFRHGIDANRPLAMHAATNRAMTDALLMMEEREQRDEALLRQALEALEQIATELPWELTGLQADTIAVLRERLGKGMEQKA